MGKSGMRHVSPLKESWLNRKIHPIWRGVGFALMILAPIIAYGIALILLEENFKTGMVSIPPSLVVQWQDPYILVKLIITVFVTMVLYALLTMIYFLISSLIGPSRYGPTDVPPVAYKGKAYKR
jgi:hypothetical protein